MKLTQQILTAGLLIGFAACSDGADESKARKAAVQENRQSDVSASTASKPVKRDKNQKPPLGPDAQQQALSIREAADKAAALVEADAAQAANE